MTSDGEMTNTKVVDLKSYKTLQMTTFSFEFILDPKYSFENQIDIKWGEQISQMDTSVLQVEWLGDEHVRQEVEGSSTCGREARVFHTKKPFDLWRTMVWLSSGGSPGIIFSLFSAHFSGSEWGFWTGNNLKICSSVVNSKGVWILET
jgi:hypothetical protein